MKHTAHSPHHSRNRYIPLIIIFVLIGVSAGVSSGGSVDTFLLHVMAGFFLVFGGFKLIDLKGFAKGYATYDLLAMRWYGYGYVYPFLEIAFGLLMLSGFHPDWLLWTEAAVMFFGGIGVVLAMRKRDGIQCVCLGTLLKVPLTSISVIENFGMATMAVLLIV